MRKARKDTTRTHLVIKHISGLRMQLAVLSIDKECCTGTQNCYDLLWVRVGPKRKAGSCGGHYECHSDFESELLNTWKEIVL